MKLWAELTMSLHQLDTASITEGGLGRRVMARSCGGPQGRTKQDKNTFISVDLTLLNDIGRVS